MIRVLIVILVIAGLAAAARAQTMPYQWIGNTSATYPGAQGIIAPTLQCQADFHPSARICRVSEILDTVVIPTPIPTTRARVWNDRDEEYGSCAFWGETGSYLVVNPDGRVASASCANPIPEEAFACCKPVPLPDPLSAIQNTVLIASAAAMRFSPRFVR